MSTSIENLAKFKVCGVIIFHLAKNHLAAEIHCEFMVLTLSVNVFPSMDTIKKKMEKQTVTMKTEVVGLPLVNDYLVKKMDDKKCENRQLTVTKHSDHFSRDFS